MSGLVDQSKNILSIQTVQISPFRTLMTALKDILLETNITFKKDGIRIINMDKSHTMLAHLFLAAENFEHYECNKDKIVVGVNMFHLFKLIFKMLYFHFHCVSLNHIEYDMQLRLH